MKSWSTKPLVVTVFSRFAIFVGHGSAQFFLVMQALEQATSAAVGGAIATGALYPLDALRTKLGKALDSL